MRQIMHRKGSVNLKEELKSLMFPISGPVCISEDGGLFQVIMTTFYQHEQSVSGDGQTCMSTPRRGCQHVMCCNITGFA